MKKIVMGAFLTTLAFTTVNCSSSSSGGTATSSFNSVYSALKESVPGSETANASGFTARADHTAFGSSIWPTVGEAGMMNNTGTVYLASLVNEDITYSVLGRVRNALMIACFLDLYGVKDSTGQLAVGTSVVVKMTTAWAAAPCPNANLDIPYLFDNAPNIDSSGAIPITMNVTDISSSGVYERKVEMLGASNPQFGGSDQNMRLTVDGTDVIFSHEEWQGTTQRSTSFVRFQASPTLIVFQHTSKNSNVEQLYRFYVNETTDKAALIANDDYPMSPTTVLRTVLTAKPSNLDLVTLSQSYTDIGGGADGTDMNGCFNFATPALTATDAAFAACNSVTGILASASNAMITTYNGKTPNDMALTDTFQKTFDETTISTEAAH